MREVILQKQYQNASQSLEEKTIASIRQILESEAFQRVQDGERNDALVSALQQNLLNLGYDLGTSGVLKNGVDGDLGDLTLNSVLEFKEEYARKSQREKYDEALATIIRLNLENGLSFREAIDMEARIEGLSRSLDIDDPDADRFIQILSRTTAEFLSFSEIPNDEIPLSELGKLGRQLSELGKEIEARGLRD